MHYDLRDDSDLLNLCDADSHAFEEIYKRYCQPIFDISMRILTDREKAKDVVQEVFIALHESSSKKSITNLKAYLFQCAKFQCFMQLRSGKISAKHLQKINHVIAANVVEDAYNAQELQLMLEKGIAALPEKCREVFYLSRYEYLSNNNIASQLNISTKTVENQITKAMKTLRTSLGKLAALLIFVQI